MEFVRVTEEFFQTQSGALRQVIVKYLRALHEQCEKLGFELYCDVKHGAVYLKLGETKSRLFDMNSMVLPTVTEMLEFFEKLQSMRKFNPRERKSAWPSIEPELIKFALEGSDGLASGEDRALKAFTAASTLEEGRRDIAERTSTIREDSTLATASAESAQQSEPMTEELQERPTTKILRDEPAAVQGQDEEPQSEIDISRRIRELSCQAEEIHSYIERRDGHVYFYRNMQWSRKSAYRWQQEYRGGAFVFQIPEELDLLEKFIAYDRKELWRIY